MFGKRKLETALHAVHTINGASARFGVGYSALVKRFLHLYRRRRFSPHEIHFNDLLDPKIRDQDLDYYMSKEEMLAFDEKHLLKPYLCMTSDKAVFYSLCAAAGLPAPRLLAVFDLPAGWTPDGRLLRSRADWCEFLPSLPREFVVKPALGLLGKGVRAFRQDPDAIVDHEGHRHTLDELYDFLCGIGDLNLFTTGYSHHSLNLPQGSHKAIVQERLTAHPSLVELTGSQTLCTCRLFTRAHRDGSIQLLGSGFRLVGGNSFVDNFDQGVGGNLWCSVDPDTGRIGDAYVRSIGGNRLEHVQRHPVTGKDVVGFHIPHWGEAVELAQRLAVIFRPQTLISWDIGVACNGAIAIEGNTGGNLLPTPMNRPVETLFAER